MSRVLVLEAVVVARSASPSPSDAPLVRVCPYPLLYTTWCGAGRRLDRSMLPALRAQETLVQQQIQALQVRLNELRVRNGRPASQTASKEPRHSLRQLARRGPSTKESHSRLGTSSCRRTARTAHWSAPPRLSGASELIPRLIAALHRAYAARGWTRAFRGLFSIVPKPLGGSGLKLAGSLVGGAVEVRV